MSPRDVKLEYVCVGHRACTLIPAFNLIVDGFAAVDQQDRTTRKSNPAISDKMRSEEERTLALRQAEEFLEKIGI